MLLENGPSAYGRRLPDAKVVWDGNVLRSKEFDDIYFHVGDGLAETYHVFLDGTDFVRRLHPSSVHHVIETGFGTGLNFLATWSCFREHAPSTARLRFASIEGYPLELDMLSDIHKVWPELGELTRALQAKMPPRWRGVHHCFFDGGRVELILIYAPIDEVLGHYDLKADTIFLDGFSPSKNPDMWSEKALTALADSLLPEGRLATFTAAGHVRRQLSATGLQVDKKPGFGRKRDMTCATKPGGKKLVRSNPEVNILGTGIAAVSVARQLSHFGLNPTFFEPAGELFVGASGNGVANQLPRLGLDNSPAHRFAQASFAFARGWATEEGFCLGQSGVHLATDEKSHKRFQTISEQNWPEDYLVFIHGDALHRLVGFSHPWGGLLHRKAGSVDVRGWLAHALSQWEVKFGCPKKDDEKLLVIAQGSKSKQHYHDLQPYLPLQYPAGQISIMPSQGLVGDIALSYGGYFTPAKDGEHIFGATFEHNRLEDNHTINPSGHEHNWSLLPSELQKLLGPFSPHDLKGRVSFRVSARDRLPAIGRLDERRYLITALGSRGMTYGPYAGYLLACDIMGYPSFAPLDVQQSLDWQRFARRDKQQPVL